MGVAAPTRYPRSMTDPLLRHVPATVHGRTLVRPPVGPHPAPWLVGFHGYAQSAEIFLPGLVQAAPSAQWLVASVQALHPFYTRNNDVVANWMTSQDRELAIEDNTGYAADVLDTLAREFGEPSAIVLAGFSQGVAMAYRSALHGRRPCAGLVTVGGDTPPELHGGGARSWPRVLKLTGTADAWYTPARLESDAAIVRAAGAEVATQVFEGGHEWGEPVVAAVREFLTRLEVPRPTS